MCKGPMAEKKPEARMQKPKGSVVLGRSREPRFLPKWGALEVNKPVHGLQKLTDWWGTQMHKTTVLSECGQA